VFVGGQTYENVYLIAVDASGYSTIVRHNPRDHAASAFDLLRERVLARVTTLATRLRCSQAQLWTWRGDGGILAIYDDNESVARDVALTAARDILRLDLEQIRAELRPLPLRGHLRLRLAVHKSTIRFTPNEATGQIHSPDVNFVVHLQETTPPDSVAISSAVFDSAGPHADLFTFVGTYEDHNVYLLTSTGDPAHARQAWLRTTGLTGFSPVFTHPQRPSQAEKARLIAAAQHDVVNLGTALRTSARYLVTTERPALFRDAVLDFLHRGGTYRGILLDPHCEATATLSEYHQENLATKIRASITEFADFKQRHSPETKNLHIYQSQVSPGFAALAADLNSRDPIILYSPYLMAMKPLGIQIDRSDSPHYLAVSGPVLASLADILRSISSPTSLDRVL
jgi:class 3 adenylate cyclase